MNQSVSSSSPSAAEKPINRIAVPLLLTLALISAVGPLAIDLYLPALPIMVTDLNTTPSGAQITLTAFFLGLMLGQIIFGVLSDRMGRIPPLYIGVILLVAASAVTVFAPTIEVLIAGRFFQALGGAAGTVIARAIVRDLVTGREAARMFSLMMIVMGVAPVIAPIAGGLLLEPIGWRGILGVLLGLAILMLIAVFAIVRETYPLQRRQADRERKAQAVNKESALRILARGPFLAFALTLSFGFAVMFAYITASPFIYQSMMGLSPLGFGLAFGINAAGITVVTAINARLVRTHSVTRLLWLGICIMLGSVALMGILVVTSAPAIWLAIPLFTSVSALGFISGNATAMALSAVPGHVTGTASAALGALQFGVAAAISPLVGLAGENSAVPLTLVMIASAVIAAVSMLVAQRIVKRSGSELI